MNKDSPQDVRRERMTFYPVIVISTIFCVSIFIVIAVTFGDQDVPVNRWVNKNANLILIVETVLLTITAIGAMTVDRLRTLKRIAAEKEANPEGGTENEPVTEVDSNVD
ncbi:hypothetical protein [Thalassoglobus sp.]|uniref:hypothetical protein n=1 Tax=Thalassoglobus sp. TaxID=2795869 RepID=UPI003AA93EF3